MTLWLIEDILCALVVGLAIVTLYASKRDGQRTPTPPPPAPRPCRICGAEPGEDCDAGLHG